MMANMCHRIVDFGLPTYKQLGLVGYTLAAQNYHELFTLFCRQDGNSFTILRTLEIRSLGREDGLWMEDMVSARAFCWTEMISYTLVFRRIRRIRLISVLHAIIPRM